MQRFGGVLRLRLSKEWMELPRTELASSSTVVGKQPKSVPVHERLTDCIGELAPALSYGSRASV